MRFWFPIVNLLLSLRHLFIYLGGPRGDGRWIFKHLLDFWFIRSPWSSQVQSSVHAEHCRTRAKSRGKAWIKIKLGLGFFRLLVSESSVGLWLWLHFWHGSHGFYSPYSTWESFQEIVLSWILLLSSTLLCAQNPLCSRVRNPQQGQAACGTKGYNFCATSPSASLIIPLYHLK